MWLISIIAGFVAGYLAYQFLSSFLPGGMAGWLAGIAGFGVMAVIGEHISVKEAERRLAEDAKKERLNKQREEEAERDRLNKQREEEDQKERLRKQRENLRTKINDEDVRSESWKQVEETGRRIAESVEKLRKLQEGGRPLSEELQRSRQKELQDKKRKSEEKFLRYLFSVLAKLAKADGQIDESEVKTAEKAFERFDFASKRRKFCIGVFNEAKANSRSVYWYAEQLGSQVTDEAVRTFIYELLWDIACADGWLHPAEKEILKKVCGHLKIPEAYFDINYRRRSKSFREGDKRSDSRKSQQSANRQQEQRSENRWRYVSGRSSILEAYSLLECEQSASVEELKAAYRRIAKRYHPDLLRQNGVPEEMVVDANKRMAQLNAAWDDIKRSRGI